MFLVIGFILWVIIGIRVFDETLNEKENERKVKESLSSDPYTKWVSVVCDKELESKYEGFLSLYPKEISSISQRLSKEAGLNLLDSGDYFSSYITLSLLAQHGKISYKEAQTGFYRDKNEEMLTNFLIWYDKELKNNGFKDSLYFLPDTCDDINQAVLAKNAKNNESGYFFWMPQKELISSLKN